jgi:DNA polymerase/3'-5' exonuclease PolX
MSMRESPGTSALPTPSDAGAARLDRPDAIAIAKAFVARLEGTYERLVVAGSLRRRLAHIGDIEIVAVPKIERLTTGLFEDMPTDVDRLDGRMQALLDNDEVGRRRKSDGSLMAWGPTWKSVTFNGRSIDLFTPDAGRFGWILLLRTGPAAFSRQLVVPKRDDAGRPGRTRDRRPGLLPIHIKPVDGWLSYRTSGERIETADERDVFDLFGLPYVEPWERT